MLRLGDVPVCHVLVQRGPVPADGGKLRVVILPNDIGVVDFDGACAEKTERGLTLHRAEGRMRFVRLGGE